MADTIQDVILSELRGLRGEVNGLRDDVNKTARDQEGRISSLETDNHSLMGNGNPGRVRVLEIAVGKLKAWRWYVVGMAVGGSAVVTLIIRK
jgi:hypothetical protein